MAARGVEDLLDADVEEQQHGGAEYEVCEETLSVLARDEHAHASGPRGRRCGVLSNAEQNELGPPLTDLKC